MRGCRSGNFGLVGRRTSASGAGVRSGGRTVTHHVRPGGPHVAHDEVRMEFELDRDLPVGGRRRLPGANQIKRSMGGDLVRSGVKMGVNPVFPGLHREARHAPRSRPESMSATSAVDCHDECVIVRRAGNRVEIAWC